MREIKFRAWEPKEKIMRKLWIDLGHIGDHVLMQYTGLKDKNGKEIYEGDIIYFVEDMFVEHIGGYPLTESEGQFREVAWNQLHCAWGLFQNGVQSRDMLADWINDDGSVPKQWEYKELEVIGNIYENPELLAE